MWETMKVTVQELIKLTGGPDAVAKASEDTPKPVCASSVHKWKRNGIPHYHWSLFLKSPGVTPDMIYWANEVARRESRKRGNGLSPAEYAA